MSQEKEVAKDTLREDILNSKDDGLGINTQLESKGTGGDGTKKKLASIIYRSCEDLHGEKCQCNNSGACNGTEELPGLCILIVRGPVGMESGMVNDDQVGNTRDGQPDPALAAMTGERAE